MKTKENLLKEYEEMVSERSKKSYPVSLDTSIKIRTYTYTEFIFEKLADLINRVEELEKVEL